MYYAPKLIIKHPRAPQLVHLVFALGRYQSGVRSRQRRLLLMRHAITMNWVLKRILNRLEADIALQGFCASFLLLSLSPSSLSLSLQTFIHFVIDHLWDNGLCIDFFGQGEEKSPF
jgi:hypothetical protein